MLSHVRCSRGLKALSSQHSYVGLPVNTLVCYKHHNLIDSSIQPNTRKLKLYSDRGSNLPFRIKRCVGNVRGIVSMSARAIRAGCELMRFRTSEVSDLSCLTKRELIYGVKPFSIDRLHWFAFDMAADMLSSLLVHQFSQVRD